MGNCCKCFKYILSTEEEVYVKLEEISSIISYSEGTMDSTKSILRESISSAPDINAKFSDFQRIAVLGTGSFGKVILVKLLMNNKLFAMKILEKDKIIKRKQVDHTKTERRLLEKLNHPFIVKLYYAFQDEKNLYFVTEYMQGGELFFHLRRNPLYKDKAVVFYLSEILLAIEYMHNNNYIYRDLKPENILIDKFGHIKLTDFGLSKIVSDENKKAYTICGTAEYLAPEILLEQGYDKTCDWFSFGVVMYEMLIGVHPFPRRFNKINPRIYSQPLKIPSFVSSHAKDLLLKLLKTNPRERLGYNGADEIKNHKYFTNVDFKTVYDKRYVPPFVPKLKEDDDLKYFDPDFTSLKVESPDTKRDLYNKEDFEGFSFQPNVLGN